IAVRLPCCSRGVPSFASDHHKPRQNSKVASVASNRMLTFCTTATDGTRRNRMMVEDALAARVTVDCIRWTIPPPNTPFAEPPAVALTIGEASRLVIMVAFVAEVGAVIGAVIGCYAPKIMGRSDQRRKYRLR